MNIGYVQVNKGYINGRKVMVGIYPLVLRKEPDAAESYVLASIPAEKRGYSETFELRKELATAIRLTGNFVGADVDWYIDPDYWPIAIGVLKDDISNLNELLQKMFKDFLDKGKFVEDVAITTSWLSEKVQVLRDILVKVKDKPSNFDENTKWAR